MKIRLNYLNYIINIYNMYKNFYGKSANFVTINY